MRTIFAAVHFRADVFREYEITGLYRFWDYATLPHLINGIVNKTFTSEFQPVLRAIELCNFFCYSLIIVAIIFHVINFFCYS